MRHPVLVNKADPNGVVASFEKRTNSALADWRAIDSAVRAHAVKGDALLLRRRAAGDSLLALYGSWESFVSSWITAAVNRDPSAAASNLADKLTEHAKTKLGVPENVLSQSLLATSHLNLAAVRQILDARGFNIAVRDYKELQRYANGWLAGPYASAVQSINAYALMPAVVARVVRNAIAHESEAALADANNLVRGSNVPSLFRVNQTRNLDVRAWRTYVLQSPAGTSSTRIEAFHVELGRLAAMFRV